MTPLPGEKGKDGSQARQLIHQIAQQKQHLEEAQTLEKAELSNDIVEAAVTLDFIVVFRRPSLKADVLGVLQNLDVIVVERPTLQSSSKFLRVLAGSWVRDKRNRGTFFQLKDHCWTLRALPYKPSVPAVVPLSLPSTLLCYEVLGEPVAECVCPMPGGRKVHIWQQGSMIEAAAELPGGWLRLTVPGDRLLTQDREKSSGVMLADTKSTFVHCGASQTGAEGCRMVFRKTKEVEAVQQSRQQFGTTSAKPSSPTHATRPVTLGSAAVASFFASSSEWPTPPPAHQTADARKRPVAYFGIVDLKYDSRRAEGSRLKVLELGSGLSSRFSGHGEPLLQKYQQSFTLVRQLDRGVLVDNKKMTHDMFVECGYEALRPKQVCYSRLYYSGLCRRLTQDLGIHGMQDALVVLKLVNRCRGAGVVVVKAGQELDDMLQLLLQPPEDFLQQRGVTLDTALSADSSSMHEQCLHWWSNECPFFVAERCEFSHPVCQSTGEFDGTMRIAFVLTRNGSTETDRDTAELGIEFLGGYWKLPSDPTTSSDFRARCVSKARTGTSPVDDADLTFVESRLQDVLPSVFSFERAGSGALARRYSKNALVFSFVMARHAVSSVQREMQGKVPPKQVLKLISMASDRLGDLPAGLPRDVAASHIHRQEGAIAAASGDWGVAVKKWHRSLELFPCNATSEHLIGYCHLRQEEWLEAESRFVRSLCLDPEFKASYANLSATYLAMARYADAKRVAEQGLKRHPFAFQCSYNVGVAAAAMLKTFGKDEVNCKAAKELALQSAQGLTAACHQKESTKSDWMPLDDDLLSVVTQLAELLSDQDAPQDVTSEQADLVASIAAYPGWQIRNFRP